ncbi:MAG TPA: hypothetical protein VLW50_00700 [Streptosporangiaceae bacterium]|nr:hypothetical protein [Streptosporangiaceae bacterium]
MACTISEDSITMEFDGAPATVAVCLDDLWQITWWPRLLTRDEAITALTLAEQLLAADGGNSFVATREELRHG